MISLVICTYNREKYLPKVLASILSQTNTSYEVVVVNNNCTDNSEQICMQFHKDNPTIEFQYHIEENQGLSYARNRGYKESKYELIAYLDDDAFITKNYVENSLIEFKKNKIDALGGKILLDYEDTPPKWENKYINSILGYFDKGDEEFFFNKKDYPRGSNMVFKKSILEEVSGFNVNLGRTGKNMNGGEEKDIFNKIYALNRKVMYSPVLVVYHTVPLARTKTEFVKKQALGIGYAEKTRTKEIGMGAYMKRLGSEAYKWGGTFGLLFIYSLKGQFERGWMLIKFRFWISSGLTFKKI